MAWQCVICGADVQQTSGPAGMYCKPHKHWRHHTCATCGTAYVGHKDRKYCTRSCIPKPEKPAPRTDLAWRKCRWCGGWMCRPGRKYCSQLCASENHALMSGCRARSCSQCKTPLGWFSTKSLCEACRASNRRARKQAERKTVAHRSRNNHRRRAKHYGVEYEPVNPLKVFARDRWRCGICRKPVNKQLKYPHPKSASLDHITPMALGGGHTYANTQCSHWICNVTKSHHGAGEQLALIG